MGIPDELRAKLKLFKPGYPHQPVELTDSTFAGQYMGISIPDNVYTELLNYTVIFGGPKTEEKLKLVFDGRQKD